MMGQSTNTRNRDNRSFNDQFRNTQSRQIKKELIQSVNEEKIQCRDRGESEWTLLNKSKKFRELLTQDQDWRQDPSALNAVRTVALKSKRGNLGTSDNRQDVYTGLRNRKPHGECNVMLIQGNFTNEDKVEMIKKKSEFGV